MQSMILTLQRELIFTEQNDENRTLENDCVPNRYCEMDTYIRQKLEIKTASSSKKLGIQGERTKFIHKKKS